MRSPRKPLLALALLGIAVAFPALAQQPAPPSPYPPPCEASKVTKGDVERAHTVFLSGKGFLDESNYDKAISYFKDAYSIDCSVHGILPIIATAYERKGDKASAIGALEEYLRRSPAASDREIIERRIRNLKDQLAQEHPVATAPTVTTPAGTATGAPTAPTSEGTATAPTATTTAPPPPGATESGTSIAPWIVVGVGAAAAVAGVVLFAVGAGDISTAEKDCPSHSNCSQSTADQGNAGRTLEGVGVTVGVIGLAGVAGGIVWNVMEKKAPADHATTVRPLVGPGYGGLVLGGSF